MKKSKIPLPIWVVGLIIVIIIVITSEKQEDKNITTQAKQYYKMHNEVVNIVQSRVKKDNKNTNTVQIKVAEAAYEPPVEEQIPDVGKKVEEEVTDNNAGEVAEDTNVLTTYETRMTSYYPQESSDCTGSGLCSWDFQANENGWYTYNGKLVVATATNYLLKYGFSLADGVHTYNYYDTLILNIDGADYEAIVLDSCGSSMQTDRVDLFVSGAEYVKDTQIIVKER